MEQSTQTQNPNILKIIEESGYKGSPREQFIADLLQNFFSVIETNLQKPQDTKTGQETKAPDKPQDPKQTGGQDPKSQPAKPSDAKPGDVKPGDVKPGDTKPVDPKAGDQKTPEKTPQTPLVNEDKTIFNLLLEMITNLTDEINYYISEILHNPEFQKLESSWFGIYNFLCQTDLGSDLKLKIMNVKMSELKKDLSRVMEFDQSALFKRVYEDEYGTFGGEPFSCLILDYYVSRSAQSFDFINRMAQLGCASHVPILTSVEPSLFDLTSFADLNVPRDLTKIFDNEELYGFNSIRNREESQYIAVAMPRVLGRLPYEPKNNPAENLEFFVEDMTELKFSWHSPAYYIGMNISKAFKKYGWTASIRGAENGGKVEDLPIFRFKDLSGQFAVQCPVEVSITDRREKELSDLGFLPLCYCKNTNYAVFFGGQTVHKPKIYNKSDATSNSRLSARLPYVLNVCRFAHYIKSIMRDKIGQYFTKTDVEFLLNNWISDYVILNSTSDPELCAKYPLKGAKIQVFERPDNPGVFSAVIHLKPHGQLEGIDVSLRLVAELPKAQG